MRLGLVIYDSLESVSGGYLYDRMLVHYLRRQGVEVDVIAIPRRSYAMQLADNLSLALYKRLVLANYDLLLQDELNHPSLFWLNLRLSRQSTGSDKLKMISIVHHLRSSEQHPVWLMWLYRVVERRYLHTVDGFIFNSQSTRQTVEYLSGSQLPSVVAPPGGNLFHPNISADEINLRSHQSGPLKLLFVGNLIPRKGLHTLLTALQQTPEAVASLTVVGDSGVDPRYTRSLMRRVNQDGLQPRVRFAGQLSQDALSEQFRTHHLVAVPSSYEGFGIIYLEGMSFGLPAIGTTSGGAVEIITHDQDGYLIAPGDQEALHGMLVDLHTNRDKLAQMSLAARKRYLAHPTWEETCAAIHDFLTHQMHPQPVPHEKSKTAGRFRENPP
ncbi:MAG: glycosyltransferase family 4 protein [Anaerolineales bacterium]